jgi:uncharacterized protein with HEPN domain
MRSVRVRLEDSAEVLAGIEQLLADSDLAAFSASWPMQRAVERGLEIISEASRGIPEPRKAAHSNVPWTQIAGIGNVLRHEYHRVEPMIVWNITQTHLPGLSTAIQRPLAEDEPFGED